MKKIVKLLLIGFLFLNIGTTSMMSAAEVSKGSGDKGVADAIMKGDGNSTGVLDNAQKKFKEVKQRISDSKKDPRNTTQDRFCAAKDSILVSGSTIAKQISPMVYFFMTILILLAIKKLFLDNPEQEKNGLSSTIIKGSLFIFFALMLSQYSSAINWWDDSVIPEFNRMCSGEEREPLKIILLSHLLTFIFVIIKMIGALIIVVGLFELVKKDRSGKVNIQGVGLKVLGGVLLIQYKYVLAFFGVIKLM